MSHRAQQNKQHPVQPTNGDNYYKTQNALSIWPILSAVAISVFIAGIVVPTFLRSGRAANHALASGSLQSLAIAGVRFSYTLGNLGFAVLGALFGLLLALAIESEGRTAKAARNFLGRIGNAASHANPLV
jgi:hypothetical protein